MGKYSFGDSVIRIAMVFAQLGITSYAIREGARVREEKEDIKKFSAEIFSINLLSMAASVIVLLILIVFVPRFHRDTIILYILGINLVTRILGRDWLNSIYEDFAYITIRYVFFQVLSIILMFAFVKKPEDYLLYIIFTVVGNSGGNILNIFYTNRYAPISVTPKLNLKKHLKPVMYLFGVALAIEIYIQSDITILGFFYEDDKVGIYYIASKVYTMVKTLLNAAVTVAIPRLAFYLGNDRKEEYVRLSGKLKVALYTIIVPCVVGVFMESENILYIIGGKEYLSGAASLRILCFALGVAVLANYYSQVALVINRKEKYFFWATAVSSVVNIGLNMFFIPWFGIEGAAITTVVSECIVLFMCRYAAGDDVVTGDFPDLIKVVIGSAAIVLICAAVHNLNLERIPEIAVAVVISAVVYGIIELVIGNSFFKENVTTITNRLFKK